MSQGFDAESRAEVIGEATQPGASALGPDDGRVEYQCPGCKRGIRIRPQYFGLKVACISCGQQFIPRPSEIPGTGNRSAAAETEIARLVASFGVLQARLNSTDFELARLSRCLAASMAMSLERSSDLAALRDRVAALDEEREKVQGRELPDFDQRAITDEIARGLAHEREATAQRWESLQREVDELRRRDEEWERREIEARDYSRMFEARLGLVEQASPQVIDQLERLRERIGAVEHVSAEWTMIREQMSVLVDQTHAIVQLGDDQANEVRTSLTMFQTEQEVWARDLAAHETRQDQVEAAVTRLDAAAASQGKDDASRWADFEARAALGGREVEALQQHLRQVDDDQTRRLGKLDSDSDRLAAIESDAATALNAVESCRDQQAALATDLREEIQRLRFEVSSLRTELATRRSAPPAIAPAVPDVPANKEQPRPTPPPVVGPAPMLTEEDRDSLIQDLARERVIGDGNRPATLEPSVMITPKAERVQVLDPVPPRLDPTGYEQSTLRFDQAMRSCRYPDAVREARLLVEFAGARHGKGSLEYAFWLRNLSLSLLGAGQPDEAREALRHALIICESKWDRTPRVVCLLDLADLHAQLREFPASRTACGQALALLDADPDPISPLRMRAQNLMARIGPSNSPASATSSITISA